MTVRAIKFTPEVIIGAPRRSSAIPNATGTLALYTVSRYSFESRERSSQICIYNLHSRNSTVFTDDNNASEPNWFGDGNQIVWLRREQNGHTTLLFGDADERDPGSSSEFVIEAPASGLKVKQLNETSVLVSVVAPANTDGTLCNPQGLEKPASSAKIYSSLFVRHWDSYVTPHKNAIWYAVFMKTGQHADQRTSRWTMTAPGLINALKDTGLESPMPPFGGTDHYDISKKGIIFVAKDPIVNPAVYTKSDVFYAPISFTPEAGTSSSQIHTLNATGLHGACTCPVFSPNGESSVFLQMKDEAYESDKNRVVVIPDLQSPDTAVELLTSPDGRGRWDRSPNMVSWSKDGKTLLLVAEDQGKVALFRLEQHKTEDPHLPVKIWERGSVSDIRPVGNSGRWLISSSNLIDNSLWTVIDPTDPTSAEDISSNTRHGARFGLHRDQISELRFTGAENHEIHAWVVRPSTFDPSQTYPLAYLIHGGPQGAWTDSWSTRWNPAVFAEQGFVVICPNPTGSTGYGQAFVDGIQNQWGGRPFLDLVHGFDHIAAHLPFVDTTRAVALGASYGGYMMNWIQGQPFGRRFKALVTHDGVFSTLNQYSTEELYFPHHDFGGPLWSHRAEYERWDPARFAQHWQTPHLIIHNELDYRVPIAEGLAAFNVLQVRGVESRFVTFPDENHWVLGPENARVWHREVLGWVGRFVGLEGVGG
ncbi:MAG: hypothetical protein M1817_004970 [Caeruleum heppii]|nr:MAG: hypothetical protein M1817_004970 [Caeruleum heppii]